MPMPLAREVPLEEIVKSNRIPITPEVSAAILAGDEEVFVKVYRQYVRFIEDICYKYLGVLSKAGYDLEDLMGEANLNFVRVVRDYDYSTGYEFITLLGKSMHFLFQRMLRDINVSKRCANMDSISVYTTISKRGYTDDKSTQIIDLLVGGSIEDSLQKGGEVWDCVKDLVSSYTNERHIRILNLFLLDVYSQAQIAEVVGVSQVQVSRVIFKFCTKLNNRLNSLGIVHENLMVGRFRAKIKDRKEAKRHVS